MSNDTSVFCCTHCGARFKGPATAEKVRCVKCQKVVERTLSSSPPPMPKPSAGSPQATKASSSNAPGPPPQPEPLGFFGYCWHSYTDTHSTLPWLFAVILGLILIPVLSFSKPLLGIGGIWCAFGVTILLALFLFAILSMTACVKYLFGKQRQIPQDGDCTWLSATICFLLTLSVALGVCAGVESFGPAKGILVALQPQLEKEQVRFFRDSSGNEPGAESVESNNGDHDATVSDRPKPNASKSTQDNSTAKTQEVIAEGVGATTDEAIKDAYRNAVRQFVGAVVDAETLVKNDEIIDDKVLTYSDGFIKGYEEVAGSKNVTGGLHRIKIKAQVERRSVIAKLKAASVTVKEVDGKGLFAEALTQLDAEKDAAALLKKQFEGFPQSCVTATVIGEPKLVSKTGETGTVAINVQIETDLNAYKAFIDKLVPVLDKLAKVNGGFTAKFENSKKEHAGTDGPAWQWLAASEHSATTLLKKEMPHAFRQSYENDRYFTLKEKTLTLVVDSGRTKKGDSIDYRYFMLDQSLQQDLVALATRAGKCKLQLLDADDKAVVTETFPIPSTVASFGKVNETLKELGLSVLGTDVQNQEEYKTQAQIAQIFIVNSVFFKTRTNDFEHLPLISATVPLALGLDELKSIQNSKVEITFDEYSYR